jgi:hypothetical protein
MSHVGKYLVWMSRLSYIVMSTIADWDVQISELRIMPKTEVAKWPRAEKKLLIVVMQITMAMAM